MQTPTQQYPEDERERFRSACKKALLVEAWAFCGVNGSQKMENTVRYLSRSSKRSRTEQLAFDPSQGRLNVKTGQKQDQHTELTQNEHRTNTEPTPNRPRTKTEPKQNQHKTNTPNQHSTNTEPTQSHHRPDPEPKQNRTYLPDQGGHDREARDVPALCEHRHEHHADSKARRHAIVRHVHARNRAVSPAVIATATACLSGIFFLRCYVAGVQGRKGDVAAQPGRARPSPG